MRKRRFASVLALLLVASLGGLAAGCFGKFRLTRQVYEINKSVEDTYVRSAVTWAFVIIPVYGFSAFLDFAVFNVIEFWSGANPIEAGPASKVHESGGETAVMTLRRAGGETTAAIERYRDGRLLSTLRIRDTGDGTVTATRTAPGKEAVWYAASLGADGSAAVTALSSTGTLTVRHPVETVATLLARAARVAGEVRVTRAAGAPVTVRPAQRPAFQG